VLAAGLGRAADGASVIVAAGGGNVSGIAGGGPATSGGARGARRPLTAPGTRARSPRSTAVALLFWR
jgi:hypothetical protein